MALTLGRGGAGETPLLIEVKPEDRRNFNALCVLCNKMTRAFSYGGDIELEDHYDQNQHELYLASHQRESANSLHRGESKQHMCPRVNCQSVYLGKANISFEVNLLFFFHFPMQYPSHH